MDCDDTQVSEEGSSAVHHDLGLTERWHIGKVRVYLGCGEF